MKAGQSVSFNELGQKENQEDSLYPLIGGEASGIPLFLVCDGVGGRDQGEVASVTVCEAFGTYFSTHTLPASADDLELFFNEALSYAYDQLDLKDNSHASATSKMGTTLTCVFVLDDCCLAAHIGDSRIYLIRPRVKYPVKYQSNDHSLANYLVSIGELLPEDVATFPQRNVILRAMQPHLPERHEAEVCILDDLQPGDYLFLCTDGVLEKLSEDNLCEVLASEQSDAEKIERIRLLCEGSYDNYTALLIPLLAAEVSEKTETQSDKKIETEKSWFKQLFRL